MKTLIPWLVTERDLRRYLSRALDSCKRGRVILFYHRFPSEDKAVLLALSPYADYERLVASARASFATGRFRRVVLADGRPLKHGHSL